MDLDRSKDYDILHKIVLIGDSGKFCLQTSASQSFFTLTDIDNFFKKVDKIKGLKFIFPNYDKIVLKEMI
jgi:hypothetical protein